MGLFGSGKSSAELFREADRVIEEASRDDDDDDDKGKK
jgi:hypothetical protein